MKQSEIADQLSYSSRTLQRYKIDINVLAPYRIQSNKTNKRTKKVSNISLATISIMKMTSEDLK